MPEAAVGDDSYAEESANIWQDMLAKSMNSSSKWAGNSISSTNLIVLGDRANGKSSVLNKFQGRMNTSTASGYIMDYSYVNVVNKFNMDKEDVVSRMSVWQLDDDSHIDLLARCVGVKDEDSISNTCIVVSLDLSRPWDTTEQLEKWLQAATSVSELLSASLTDEQKANLKKKVSQYVQTYEDYSEAPPPDAAVTEGTATPEDGGVPKDGDTPTSAEEGKDGEVENTQPGGETENEQAPEDDKPIEIPVDLSVPAKNLGVPLLIVGNKADYFARGMETAGADKKFEFLTKRLRKTALEYGASLVLTSAVGEGTNIELLQDYINHRTLHLPFRHTAKAIGNYDDFGLCVPAGFDSAALIETGGTASGWNDQTSMSEVFTIPPAVLAQKNGAKRQAPSVQAQTDDDFFHKIAGAMGASLPAPVKSSSNSDLVEEGEPEYFDRGRTRSTTIRSSNADISRGRAPSFMDVGGAPPPPMSEGAEAADGEKKKKKIKVGKFFKNLLK